MVLNIQSVANAFYRLGTKPNISDGAGLLSLSPNHIVLPGVGAMGHALAMLLPGLEEALTRLVREEKHHFWAFVSACKLWRAVQ